ncbi:hypothetical protein DID77_03905, partial [Candidatus Marinamargulisbacteria bacterium SCGC AG-439-L15]
MLFSRAFFRHCLVGFIFCLCGNLAIGDDALLYSTLKDGVGIQGISMGNARTAGVEGAVSMFYNPAGFSVKGLEYSFQSHEQKSTELSYFGAHQFYLSPFGVSHWRKKKVDGDTTEVTAFGYGHQNVGGLSWGFNFKGIKDVQNSSTSYGWSSDLGTILHVTRFMNWGFLAQDVVSDGSESLELPVTMRTGFSFFSKDKQWVFNTDLVQHKRPQEKTDYALNYGLEYHFLQGMSVRLGSYSKYYT